MRHASRTRHTSSTGALATVVAKSIAIVGLGLAALPTDVRADPVADFYRGKTVSLVSGFTPSGEYDTESRLVGRHLGRHIPGQPNIVATSMPGAASLVLANHLYKIAQPDGTFIGMVSMQVAVDPFLKSKVAVFDPLKFNYIGILARNQQFCAVTPGPGVATSMEDLLRRDGKETLFGSAGPSSDIHQNTAPLKNVLGARIRIVSGYPGMPAIKLAVEHGEINGVCGLTAGALRRQHGADLASGRLKLVVQLSGAPTTEFGRVPQVIDYARGADERELLDFIYGSMTLGRPIAVPPAVPSDRVDALRKAFADTLEDKAFIDEAKTLNIDISPTAGPDIAAQMQRLSKVPDAFFAKVIAAQE